MGISSLGFSLGAGLKTRNRKMIPLLDLNAQNLPLADELRNAFDRVLQSGRFILGPEVDQFEQAVAGMAGAAHGIGVSSGTDAILLALMALEIGPGDEVLCPSFTFFATAGCIARCGATPVFVDSCPLCFNMNVSDAAAKVTDRTKAVMPVHLFGQAADMDGVMALATQHGLAVIEDAAQSLGAGYRGRKVGGIATFGTFSFFPSKNLGGFGDGGLLVTSDDRLAERATILRTHGAQPKYYHRYIGGNFRMDPLQAALLTVKLPHYTGYTEQRQANAEYYTDHLSRLDGVAVAEVSGCVRCQAKSGSANGCAADGSADAANRGPDSRRILLPAALPGHDHIWNQYTLRVFGEGRRDALKQHLTDHKIGSEIYYPVPMHQQECFRGFVPPDRGAACPVAEQLASECLSIPIYPELTDSQKDEVIAAIREWVVE